MEDPIIGVLVDNIKWFHNGVWQAMPHRHFFCNNLRQHFKRSNRHMPKQQKEVWETIYKDKLLHKEVLHINNIKFKVATE